MPRKTRQSKGPANLRPRRTTKPKPLDSASPTPALPPPDAEHVGPSHVESAGPMIVAVGASAGGLEAFSQILEKLAASPPVAFIFVQHLSPQHESALPALLSARTTLPVVQVADGMTVEASRLYVMPPNVRMEIGEGRFRLLPRPRDHSQFTPIDHFFASLAQWAQERTVGVILSGTASDGATGLREIKAAGGITIAQKPDSAKYEGMPKAAIATGEVDLVLSPLEIAEYIGSMRGHPYLRGLPSDDATASPPTEEQFRELFALLRRASGIDFRQYKPPTVRRRLLRRMALQRLTDVDAYLRFLREHPPEMAALCQDLLIHVTRFFRDPESFKALEAHVLPEILQERGDEAIRIWVPGCATGEEAYSIAILVIEMLGDPVAERKVQIFATDVSENAIDTARSGTYPSSISVDLSPERLKRFFTKSNEDYRVSKSLRDLCVFARHDLARDPPFSRLDLVVCRNVLIYLDTALQKRIVSIFQYALKARGFLMLGSAETTGAHSGFTPIDKKWRLYKKAPVDALVTFALASGRPLPLAAHRSATQPPVRLEGRPVAEEANRVVLDKYGPPGVVVDANFDVVHFRGHTGPFLEAASGEPSLNVLKMARDGLLYPLRSALSLARKKRKPVRKEDVLVQRNGDWHQVNLEIIPLATPRGEFFLILFESPTVPAGAARPRHARKAGRLIRPRAADDVRLADLRRELAASREYMQSVIEELEGANEELQSANEEILSSNEELQSTNEELDTAREELQSTNEELNTVNEELHSRNQELATVNGDLVNLLGSVQLPIIIVDRQMAVRRFTPAAERLFNLIPGDVGRPIDQINANVVCDDLPELLRMTIEGLEPQAREVQDRRGRWYSLRIRPYRAVDDRLDGAVVTLIDIDDAKRYQRHIERAGDYFRRIVETVTQPLLVLDPDLRVQTASRSFYEVFGLEPERTVGVSILQLSNGLWDVPELRTVLAEAAKDDAKHYLPFEHPLPTVGSRRITLNARGFELDEATHGILIAMDLADERQKGH